MALPTLISIQQSTKAEKYSTSSIGFVSEAGSASGPESTSVRFNLGLSTLIVTPLIAKTRTPAVVIVNHSVETIYGGCRLLIENRPCAIETNLFRETVLNLSSRQGITVSDGRCLFGDS